MMKKLFLALLTVGTAFAIFAADAPAPTVDVVAIDLPGAAKVWGSSGKWNNFQEVVDKVDNKAATINTPQDDATYRVCLKMLGTMTGAELKAYAESRKEAWIATDGEGVRAYYQLLRFAARNEKDPAFLKSITDGCKAALAVADESNAARNTLYWIAADAWQCGEALMYWSNSDDPRSLNTLIDLGVRNKTLTAERGYLAIRDYLYDSPSRLDGAMACKLYDQALRLSMSAGVSTADLKTAVVNLDQLYATRGTGNADWTLFRQKLTDQLAAFKRSE